MHHEGGKRKQGSLSLWEVSGTTLTPGAAVPGHKCGALVTPIRIQWSFLAATLKGCCGTFTCQTDGETEAQRGYVLPWLQGKSGL